MTPKEAISGLNYLCKGISNLDTLEAITQGINALEKQIPKRPRVDDDSWYCCPRCDETFFMWDKLSRRLLYCGNCGQKLDWSKADAQKRSDTNDR